MSLLLDALSRAEKDKAASASPGQANTSNDWPAIGLVPQVAETAATSSESLPTPSVVADASAIVKPDDGLSLEPVQNAPLPLTMPPVPSATSAVTPTRAQDNVQAPLPKAAPPKQPTQPNKAAQTLLRAKTPAVASRRPQLIVLSGLAILLAAGLASLSLGWIDPMALLNPGSSIRPAVQLASTPPAQVAAPVPPTDVASAPVAVEADGASKPSPGQVTPPLSTANTGINPNNSRRKPDGKAAPDRQAPSALAATSTQTIGGKGKVPGPLADCEADSPATDCRPTTRPVAKARPKAVAPKPTEAASAVIAKVTGPSQLEQAYAALTQGRWTDAASFYNKVLAQNPEERDALLGLAYIAHQGARDEEARELYKRVLRQEPGNASALAGLLVQTLGNNSEDVTSSSREVAEQNPGSAAAQSVLGHSLVRQGRLADAQQAFQRAQALEPGIALHAYNLAVAFDRLRNYGAARSFYERALALSRQNGGEPSSGVSHSVVQNRLLELQGTKALEAPATR